VGVQYRPRTGFGSSAFASSGFAGRPGVRFGGMAVGGVHTLTRGPALRPSDVVGGRRVPTSVRLPNGESRMDGPTVFGPGRRAAFSGTRAIPNRPRIEPTMRAPEVYRGNAQSRARVAEPPTRVNAGTRVNAPGTRVNAPRGRPFEVSPQRPNFQPGMRAEPAERVPAPRVESPRMESPRMQAPRPESPRFEGTRAMPRMTEPRMAEPRMSEPRMSEPRMAEPRMSAPRESSPRMSAPRMSAPRSSQPRMSSGGMRGGGGGGGGGGHHHR